MVASSNFAELLWPGLAEIWGDSYNDWDALYSKIFQIKKSSKRFEKEQGVTGLGLAGLKDEGASIGYDDPFQGAQKEYVMTTYALGVNITRELADDEMYDYINSIPKKLARSMRQTEETLAFNHLNNGSTAAFVGADGLTLFNASHTLVGGGTYRNQLAAAADLSQTSLEQTLQDIMDWVDDRGLKINAKGVTLVVPTQVNFRARKILGTEKVTGGNDKDMNPLNGALKLVVSPFLTDNDCCFVITDIDNGLVWYNRRDAEIVRDNEFDTQNMKIATTRRFSSGWTDPRGAFSLLGA